MSSKNLQLYIDSLKSKTLKQLKESEKFWLAAIEKHKEYQVSYGKDKSVEANISWCNEYLQYVKAEISTRVGRK